ncbi:hypothetical protein BC936DRAFT_138435, partial [Jimgerdemannia flammicorona]
HRPPHPTPPHLPIPQKGLFSSTLRNYRTPKSGRRFPDPDCINLSETFFVELFEPSRSSNCPFRVVPLFSSRSQQAYLL